MRSYEVSVSDEAETDQIFDSVTIDNMGILQWNLRPNTNVDGSYDINVIMTILGGPTSQAHLEVRLEVEPCQQTSVEDQYPA